MNEGRMFYRESHIIQPNQEFVMPCDHCRASYSEVSETLFIDGPEHRSVRIPNAYDIYLQLKAIFEPKENETKKDATVE